MKHPIRTKIYKWSTRMWDYGFMCWFWDIIRDWSFNEDLYLD